MKVAVARKGKDGVCGHGSIRRDADCWEECAWALGVVFGFHVLLCLRCRTVIGTATCTSHSFHVIMCGKTCDHARTILRHTDARQLLYVYRRFVGIYRLGKR
jgi:hypothetical protein